MSSNKYRDGIWTCSKCYNHRGRYDQWFEGDICEDCYEEPKEKTFTLKEISKAWKKVYGESLRLEYSGFYKKLKTQK